jgi:hypothetical protein
MPTKKITNRRLKELGLDGKKYPEDWEGEAIVDVNPERGRVYVVFKDEGRFWRLELEHHPEDWTTNDLVEWGPDHELTVEEVVSVQRPTWVRIEEAKPEASPVPVSAPEEPFPIGAGLAVERERDRIVKLIEAAVADHFDTKRMCGSCHETHYRRRTMDREDLQAIVRKIKAGGAAVDLRPCHETHGETTKSS